jgi:hypothetical protein
MAFGRGLGPVVHAHRADVRIHRHVGKVLIGRGSAGSFGLRAFHGVGQGTVAVKVQGRNARLDYGAQKPKYIQ